MRTTTRDTILYYTRKHSGKLLGLFAFSLFDIGMSLLQPWPTKIVIDSVFGDVPAPLFLEPYTGTIQLLAMVTIFGVVLFAIQSLSQYIQMLIAAKVNHLIDRSIRQDLFLHIISLPPTIFDELDVGEYIYRENRDTEAVADSTTGTTIDIAEAIITMVAAVVLLSFLNWKLLLITLVSIPVLYLTSRHYTPIVRKLSKKLKESLAGQYSFTAESFQNTEHIQTFSREDDQAEGLKRLINKNYEIGLKLEKKKYAFGLFSSVSSLLSTTGLLFFGGIFIFNNELTVGELILFFSYSSFLTEPLETLTEAGVTYQEQSVSIKKVLEIINNPSAAKMKEVKPAVHAEDFALSHTGGPNPIISVEEVTIKRDDNLILNSASMEVYYGEKIAVIGASGTGKSTLFQLLMRYLEPDSGKVVLHGFDIQTTDIHSLRSQYSLVSQTPAILTGTVYDNIVFGAYKNKQYTRRQYEEAVAKAQIDEFVSKFKDGYNTILGKSGVSLSSGQKQRIAIARAIMRGSPILLLDEPTSALDSKNAEQIIGSLTYLMEGTTTVMITHNLKLLNQMDRVYLLKDGQFTQMRNMQEVEENLLT